MSNTFSLILLVLLGAGFAMAFIRLVIARTAGDRAVALDGATLISVDLMVLMAFLMGRSMLLDVVLVYALLSFLGVLAIARYLEGGL